MTAKDFMAALAKYQDKERGQFAKKFFRVGGATDEFLGATVPNTRLVCKEFKDLPLAEVQRLLDSPIHDHRLGAVILLVNQYKKAKDKPQVLDDIFALYLKNVRKGRVNNWDIVDSSAAYIIGPHEQQTNRKLLFELAKSGDIWQRRVSILSAFYYVQHNDPTTTLELAERLLHDKEDLIQKAVGWQLREVGKHSAHNILMKFLDKHAATMPRTALRYAIEHLTPEQRKHYLNLRRAQ
ncbi:MAG TPA: DNA alkylation repair protein [Candidatus Saccharimonadales bacterium]|nr:DNA alkylation repair protein [Candidatus Saccharimonadales bacterium]